MKYNSSAVTRVLILAMSIAVISAPAGAKTSSILGDVNGDGVVNISDAILILRASVGLVSLSMTQLQVADINKDGKVNALDVTPLIQKVAGLHPAAFATRFDALSTLPTPIAYVKSPSLPKTNAIPALKPTLKSPPSLPVHPPIIPWIPY